MSRLRHLPDLPTAGYSSRRQKETTDAVMFWLRGIERKRLMLLHVVLDGRDKWRYTAGKVWRGLLIDGDLLDSVYGYMALLALGSHPNICFSGDPAKLVYVIGKRGLTARLHRLLSREKDALEALERQTPLDKVWGHA